MTTNTGNYKKPVKKTDMKTLYPLIEPIIKQGGTVKIKVTGYSMYPLVSSRRDSVLLGKCVKPKIGDVPLFRRKDGSYILHRIVGKKNGAFYTMGDYETQREYPVYPEQIVAVAKGFYRKDRFWSCDSFTYKLYSALWRKTVFVRPFLLKRLAGSARVSDSFFKF